MVVCQFYLRGQCKFGNACKNEHPLQRPGGFGMPSGPPNTGNGPAIVPFTQEGLAKDITPGAEKPLWPLSSFGSAKSEPTLIANLDESPEELHWKAVQALKSGNVADYQKYESEKIQEADQTYAKALSEIPQVYNHAYKSAIAKQRGILNPAGTVYNSPSNTASPAFGKSTASAFGGLAFGGGSSGTASAFGASASTPASAFGSSTSASAVGKPSFGQSAFGQPAFGQSAFGQPSKPVSAFGQPSQTTSAFGQPAPTTSAFGQPAQPSTSGYGQTSQPQSSFIKPATGFGSSAGGGFSAFAGGGTSAFGAGAQQTQAPAVGQSAFGGTGNNAAAAPTTSAFGTPSAPSAFGAPASSTHPTSAFGLPMKPVSAFGQPSQTASAFGQPSQPVSAFGKAAQAPAFGQTSASGQTAQPSALGQTSQPSAFGQTSSSAFGQPLQPVSAFGGAGAGTSSGFAAAGLPPKPKVGPPDFAAALAAIKAEPGKDKHDGLLPRDYADKLPASVKEAFAAPRFEWGKIPEWVPPVEFR